MLLRLLASLTVAALLSWIATSTATLAASVREAPSAEPKVQALLIADVAAVKPGTPFTIALQQNIAPHWHTYWKNPGDSGEPTRISWKPAPGFEIADIDWPIPDAIPVGPLMNYGYSDTLLLPIRVAPPTAINSEEITLEAHAEWLACETICIPEAATVSITLPVHRGVGPPPTSGNAALVEAAMRRIPIDPGWTAKVTKPGKSIRLDVAAPGLDATRISEVRFFPEDWGMVEHAAPQPVSWRKDGFLLELQPSDLTRSGAPQKLNGVIVISEMSGPTVLKNGFRITGQSVAEGVAAPLAAPNAPADGHTIGEAALGVADESDAHSIGLFQALIFAVLGGMILNVMPCVLPILSMKVMGLAASGGENAMRPAFAYLAGVLVCFALIAGLLGVLKASGETLGWGFQFQSAGFILAMAALFFALGLSMSGVFEIGSGISGVGDSLTRREGLSGSFFTGVLATVAATPCTAPFMGAALGFALTRSTVEMTAVLLALGLGFALPLVALSLSGAPKRLLPKPGPWMRTLKELLAFPLYLTVVWLVWVLSQQTGSDGVLAAGLVLTVVSLAAWLLSQVSWSPVVRVPAAMLLAIGAVSWGVLVTQAESNALASPSEFSSTTEGNTASIDALPYSPETVERLRGSGKPVFVNFTAAWCISCKVNERLALSGASFNSALQEHGIAYLKADWTNKDDSIARILKLHGRAGVPLYLLYPAEPTAAAVILPQLLTEAIVLRHFASLSRKTSTTPSISKQ